MSDSLSKKTKNPCKADSNEHFEPIIPLTAKAGEKPFVLGICGSTCAGKEAIVQYIRGKFALEKYLIECVDDADFARNAELFDVYEYENYDWEAMEALVEAVKAGRTATFTPFDKSSMRSTNASRTIGPCDVLVLKGSYFLTRPALAAACNLKVYLDTEPDELFTRFVRRRHESVSLDELVMAYMSKVKPNREQYMEPTKARADFVLFNFDGHAKSLSVIKKEFPVVHVLKEYLHTTLIKAQN